MSENFYYGHGKLMLTSEYFVLDGAKALALPTKLGQRMHVSYRPSRSPKLFWKAFDSENNMWVEATFELWHFNILSINDELNCSEEVHQLRDILIQARKQNIHFLREELDVYVNTVLEFPRDWGLGTSSTLIYNIAQWAYISPFELLEKTFGGSGYDIACAQSMGPILYQNLKKGPQWETVEFCPLFKNQIYFVFLNNKQNSREGIERYRNSAIPAKDKVIHQLNDTTYNLLNAIDLKEFESLIATHEHIISKQLDLPRVKDTHFSDYWGEIKSLGAWGGDFALVTSDRTKEETITYFKSRGHNEILEFDELILQNFAKYLDPVKKLENVLNNVNA